MSDKISRFFDFLTGAIFFLICAAILSPDYAVLHDFSEWLYQAQLFNHLVSESPQNSAFGLAPYPVPNSITTVSLAMLSGIFPPSIAGKLFLIGLLTGWLLVLRAFVGKYFEGVAKSELLFTLFSVASLSSYFWLGLSSYQVALLLLVWFLSLSREKMSAPVVLCFSVLVFFSHAMVFLVFGLFVSVHALIQRRPWLIIALAPSGLLGLWFLAGRRIQSGVQDFGDGWLSAMDWLVFKIGNPATLGAFKNLLRPDGQSFFEELPTIYWLAFTSNLLMTAALGLVTLFALSRYVKQKAFEAGPMALNSAAFASLVLLLVAYICLPYSFFGLINPSGRLILPMLFLVFLLGRSLPALPIRIAAFCCAFGAIITSLSYLVLATDFYTNPIPLPTEVKAESGHASALDRSMNSHSQTRYQFYNLQLLNHAQRLSEVEQRVFSDLSFTTGIIIKVE